MGGNAIKGAIPIRDTDFPEIFKHIVDLLPPNILIFPIGSAGQKPAASDIDIMLDIDNVSDIFDTLTPKQTLTSYFKSLGLHTVSQGNIHIGLMTTAGYYQVDFILVKNAEAISKLHTHDYSLDPTMSGGDVHRILADLVSVTPNVPFRHYMISPFIGLVERDTKKLVSNDKNTISKIIFNDTAATANDIKSLNAISAKIQNNPHFAEIYRKHFS